VEPARAPELDSLFHQPNWTPSEPADFQARLQAAMDQADDHTGGWTTCGNYRSAGGRINQSAADTIVWLDMPRWLIMSRITRRTVRRAITRQVLWNGNREGLFDFLKWDPHKNMIRWAWVNYDLYREQNLAAMADDMWSHATVHHLRSRADVERFIARAAR